MADTPLKVYEGLAERTMRSRGSYSLGPGFLLPVLLVLGAPEGDGGQQQRERGGSRGRKVCSELDRGL